MSSLIVFNQFINSLYETHSQLKLQNLQPPPPQSFQLLVQWLLMGWTTRVWLPSHQDRWRSPFNASYPTGTMGSFPTDDMTICGENGLQRNKIFINTSHIKMNAHELLNENYTVKWYVSTTFILCHMYKASNNRNSDLQQSTRVTYHSPMGNTR
jgi:hypothetical protein